MAWSWCGPGDPAVFKIHFSFAVPPTKRRSINKSSRLNLGGGSALVGFVLHCIALGAESGCSTAQLHNCTTAQLLICACICCTKLCLRAIAFFSTKSILFSIFVFLQCIRHGYMINMALNYVSTMQLKLCPHAVH